MYNHQQLKETFDYMKDSHVSGIHGAHFIQGTRGISCGPTALISAMTHGNEVSGLAALRYILENRKRLSDRLCGGVLLTVNNIRAGERYFEATTPDEKMRARQADVNMNRLPEDSADPLITSGAPYEVRRLQQLLPLLRDVQAGLDLHSTPSPSEPIVLDVKGDQEGLDHLTDGVPISTRLQNMTNAQKGIPISRFYGGLNNNDVPVLGVETGCHEAIESVCIAVQSALAFLAKLEMLDNFPMTQIPDSQRVYRVEQPIFFPNASYRLERVFPMFEPVMEGEEIARGDGEPIKSSLAGHAIFGRPTTDIIDPKQLEEEQLFLTSIPRYRHRILSLYSESY